MPKEDTESRISGRQKVFLKHITEAVEANLNDEQFGVESLADQLNISRSQLHRRLHSAINMAPSVFIRLVRLNHAKRFLIETDKTAAEIAYEVGFNSPNYFNTCFHEQYGITPGEYRKNKDRNELISSSEEGLINQIDNIPAEQEISSGQSDDSKTGIAVLPFIDMSPGGDHEWFSEGISEELLNVLAKVPGLKVAGRTSSWCYKGTPDKDLRQIGKELGVGSILEGSVRTSGEDLRITVQLINASDGMHIWSETYDRQLEDVFELQQNISHKIVNKLQINLQGKEYTIVDRKKMFNIEAYNNYLKGLHCARFFTPEGTREAMRYFEAALGIDPNLAHAYYGLGYLFTKATFFGNVPPMEGYVAAKKYLGRAIQIDDTLAEAHAAKGLFVDLIFNWNWENSEKELAFALELNPESASVHYAATFLLMFQGRFDKAIKEAKKAVELDPLSSLFNTNLGQTYFYGHQIQKSIEVLEKTEKMNPNDFITLYHLGHSHEGNGNMPGAIEKYEKCVDITKRASLPLSSLACSYYLNGEVEKADRVFEELMQKTKIEYVPPVMIYSYHMVKGDLDQAYYWLKRGIEEHDSYLLFLTICPTAGHCIPKDARFQALASKFRFDP